MIRITTEVQTSKPPRVFRTASTVHIRLGELTLELPTDQATDLAAKITAVTHDTPTTAVQT